MESQTRWLAPLILAWLLHPSAGLAAGAGVVPELVVLSAGSQIKESVPRGWSHLVLKSVPRLESGDLGSLPKMAESTATLFRTVIAADVRGSASGYALRRIGLGLCVPVQGVDTTVDEASGSSPPFSLGIVERQVLSRTEIELKKARLIARSPTYAVLAAPSELKTSEGHQPIYLVYVLLVDAATGRLRTLVWAIRSEAARRSAPGSMTELKPGVVYRCGLDVEADRLLGAIPVNWSFAMNALPPGERIALPAGLRAWAADLRKIAENPEGFEDDVRAALRGLR